MEDKQAGRGCYLLPPDDLDFCMQTTSDIWRGLQVLGERGRGGGVQHVRANIDIRDLNIQSQVMTTHCKHTVCRAKKKPPDPSQSLAQSFIYLQTYYRYCILGTFILLSDCHKSWQTLQCMYEIVMVFQCINITLLPPQVENLPQVLEIHQVEVDL